MEMSEGSRDEGYVYAEYSCNLHPGQRIERQDHRTQDPPKIREHGGVFGIRKRVCQNLGVQWVYSCPSFINGAVRRGNDQLDTFIGLVMFRFDEPNQGGRKDEESR